MDYRLNDLVLLPHLTVGRRHLALDRMSALVASAPPPGPQALAAVLPAAVAEQAAAITVLKAWYRARVVYGAHEDGARALHLDVSRAVGALVGAAEGLRDGGEPELAILAEHLLDTQFPNGLKGNTALPWVDQLLDLESVLTALDSPDYVEHRAKLPLEPQIARIAKLTPLFAQKLARPQRVTWETAKAAERRAESAFLAVIAVVCGVYHQDTDPDVAARRLLLEPVFDQIEMLAALRAARRAAAKGVLAPVVDASPPAPPLAAEAEQASLAEDLSLDADSPPTHALD